MRVWKDSSGPVDGGHQGLLAFGRCHAIAGEGEPESACQRDQQSGHIAQAPICALEALDADEQGAGVFAEGNYVAGPSADPSSLGTQRDLVEEVRIARSAHGIADVVVVLSSNGVGPGYCHRGRAVSSSQHREQGMPALT